MSSDINGKNTAASYDQVAAAYAKQLENELDYKPFDRKMLEMLVERAVTKGAICDLGCGPGQIAAYLAQIGASACGIDLSARMVAEAQHLHPRIPFQQGDMLALTDIDDGFFGGIAAFYSIIHVPAAHLMIALREFHRVLCDAGNLLITFHIGDEIRHLDRWFDQPVNVDFHFHQTADVITALQAAGFEVEEVIERDPYPQEVQTRRAYLFSRKLV